MACPGGSANSRVKKILRAWVIEKESLVGINNEKESLVAKVINLEKEATELARRVRITAAEDHSMAGYLRLKNDYYMLIKEKVRLCEEVAALKAQVACFDEIFGVVQEINVLFNLR